ncbi:sterol desaturase family protein [Plectonema radiosum]|nr:sterol desaturase family protein [Plectonema radiosum]
MERIKVNAGVSAIAAAINLVMVQTTALFTIEWAERQSFGLVRQMPLQPLVQGAIAFLLLDLTFYYWHRANHQIPFLWRFHNAHHIDPDLDVSTGFRFHFVEMILSIGVRGIQVVLIGASVWAYVIYELVYQTNTLFHHSNVYLPLPLERWLNRLLVTPRMHGIHHSWVQEETNSNYSVIFPWWDRLHHTLHLNVPQSEITIGVPAYSEPNDNMLLNVLLIPFRHQRNYWLKADQTSVKRNPEVLGEDPTHMVSLEEVDQSSDRQESYS